MEMVTHKAIAVTCANPERTEKARVTAVGIGLPVSSILSSPANGYWTFFIGPDGSTEGSPEADSGNERRIRFVEWLKAQESEQDGHYYEWGQMEYGNDKVDEPSAD